MGRSLTARSARGGLRGERSSTWEPRGFRSRCLGGVGGGCGPGAGSRPGRPGIEPAGGRGGPGAGRRGRGARGARRRGAGARAGFPNAPAESGRRLSGSRGPLSPSSQPRGPAEVLRRSSWVSSRSAVADTGASSLPAARRVSPRVLSRSPSAGRGAGSRTLSPQPGKPAGQGRKDTRLRGSWEAAAARPESVGRLPLLLSLPSRSLRAPGAAIPVEAGTLSAPPKAARRGPGPSLGRDGAGRSAQGGERSAAGGHSRGAREHVPPLPRSRPPPPQVPRAPPPPRRDTSATSSAGRVRA